MKYLFVYKNDCWWLKIKTVDELTNYSQKTDGRWAKAFDSLIHAKEFYEDGKEHASNLAYVIGQWGVNREMNVVEAVADFRSRIFDAQLDLILEGHIIFINEKGGYHFDTKNDEPVTQFVWRDELVFPNFPENEIHIKHFPGGKHFYAYIGDMQVRDGDVLKWNTYEEAMEQAKKVVTKAQI